MESRRRHNLFVRIKPRTQQDHLSESSSRDLRAVVACP